MPYCNQCKREVGKLVCVQCAEQPALLDFGSGQRKNKVMTLLEMKEEWCREQEKERAEKVRDYTAQVINDWEYSKWYEQIEQVKKIHAMLTEIVEM